MHVDIEDGDALLFVAQALRGDGGVVQEAEAARHVGIGVVARRSAERIGVVFSRQYHVGHSRGDLGCGERGVPGVRPDGAGQVDLVPAGAAGKCFRVGGMSTRRMDVGHDFGARTRRPFARGDLQEVDIVRRVHRGGRPGAIRSRRQDRVAGRTRGGQQAGGALRLLGAALPGAAHDEVLRVVLGVLFGIDDLHDVTLCWSRWPSPSRARRSRHRYSRPRA